MSRAGVGGLSTVLSGLYNATNANYGTKFETPITYDTVVF